MRYDILIIWGNGLNCVPHIINEIAIDSNFQIVRLKYHSFTNINSHISITISEYNFKRVHLHKIITYVR